MNKPLTITIGTSTKSLDQRKHPYMRNNFLGTDEIQETFKEIYRIRDEIKERRVKEIKR